MILHQRLALCNLLKEHFVKLRNLPEPEVIVCCPLNLVIRVLGSAIFGANWRLHHDLASAKRAGVGSLVSPVLVRVSSLVEGSCIAYCLCESHQVVELAQQLMKLVQKGLFRNLRVVRRLHLVLVVSTVQPCDHRF